MAAGSPDRLDVGFNTQTRHVTLRRLEPSLSPFLENLSEADEICCQVLGDELQCVFHHESETEKREPWDWLMLHDAPEKSLHFIA